MIQLLLKYFGIKTKPRIITADLKLQIENHLEHLPQQLNRVTEQLRNGEICTADLHLRSRK